MTAGLKIQKDMKACGILYTHIYIRFKEHSNMCVCDDITPYIQQGRFRRKENK